MSLPRRVCVDEIVLSIPTKDFLILGYLTELVDGLQPRIPDELRRDVGECLRLSFALPTMRTLVKGCSVETYWGLVQVAGGFAVVNCSPLGFDFLRWDSSGALLCRKTFSFPPGVLAHVGEPFFTSDTSGSSIYVVSYSSLSEQLSVSILPLEGKEKYYYVSWPDARKAEPYIAGVKELCSRLYILAFESNGDRLLWLDLDRLSYGKLNEFSGSLSLGLRSRFTFDPRMHSDEGRNRINLFEWPPVGEAYVYRRSVDVAAGRIQEGTLLRLRSGLHLQCWLTDDLACLRSCMNSSIVVDFARISLEGVDELFSIELCNAPCGYIPLTTRRLLITSYVGAGRGRGLTRWHESESREG